MATSSVQPGEGHWGAVAEAIRARMDELRVTQVDLAAKSGIGLSTVQELTTGVVRRRQARTLAPISEALGWPTDHILRLSRGEASQDQPMPQGKDGDGALAELHALRQEMERIKERLAALEAPDLEDGR